MSMTDRLEAQWIDSDVEEFGPCGVQPGDACTVLFETLSWLSLVQLSALALPRLGTRWFHRVVPTPRQSAPIDPVAVRPRAFHTALLDHLSRCAAAR